MSERRLKTLTDHNRERYDAYTATVSHTPIPNGLECPNCRSELLDSDPMSTLTVNPPQKRVHCGACSFNGTRLA